MLLLGMIYSSYAVGEKHLDLSHYGYAAYLGTGIYRTSDRMVQVYNFPMSYTLRQVAPERWGINIKFPVTLGFYDFEAIDIPESGLPDKVETLTVIPGVEWVIPIKHSWHILPFLDYGAGWNFETDQAVNIYAWGIKSLSEYHVGKKSTLALSNRYYFVGHKEKNTRLSDDFRALENGLSIDPAYGLTFFGRPADLHFYYVNFIYSNLEFLRINNKEFEVDIQNELGFTFSLAKDKKLKVFDIPRIGLGYRWGDKLDVIRIIIGAPF